jgi:ferritin-like protein
MPTDAPHEPAELVTEPSKELHRALRSLIEELEAIDWYQQRVDASRDDELRAVLGHNRDEEVEHAMMVLEWIRRQSPTFDRNIGTYLGAAGPITQIEGADEAGEGGAEAAGGPGDGSLGIGSLRARAAGPARPPEGR